MEPRYELLDPVLDAKHRGRFVCTRGAKEIPVLRLRTPKTSWRIHDQWIERYVVHIFLKISSGVVAGMNSFIQLQADASWIASLSTDAAGHRRGGDRW